MEWQLIETAPKDGTAVLVHRISSPPRLCDETNTYVASWWATEDGSDGCWVCFMDAIQDPECPIKPTHWRPLPAPPKPGSETH